MITGTLQYKQLVRMLDFADECRRELPPCTVQFIGDLASGLTTVAALSGTQASIFRRARQFTQRRNRARIALRDALVAVYRAANTVEIPGFSSKFQLPPAGDRK